MFANSAVDKWSLEFHIHIMVNGSYQTYIPRIFLQVQEVTLAETFTQPCVCPPTSSVFTSRWRNSERGWPAPCTWRLRCTITQVLRSPNILSVKAMTTAESCIIILFLFSSSEITLSESFTNQSTQFYDAEPVRLMETSEENTQMINSWVANKTNNQITELLDSVSPNSQLILLNAVSFSGQWSGWGGGSDYRQRRVTHCVCLCVSGQWKMMFEEKPKKGHFTKLGGDLVKVPLLYRHKYLATLMHVVELKAQVRTVCSLSRAQLLYDLCPCIIRALWTF